MLGLVKTDVVTPLAQVGNTAACFMAFSVVSQTHLLVERYEKNSMKMLLN